MDTQVQNGEVCARCKVEFDGAHQVPVLCHTCHSAMLIGALYPLPKAWLEEKVK